MRSNSTDHFFKLVSDWSHFGPPLRPSPADTGLITRLARELEPDSRVVMLGVTPETATCGFHPATRLLAFDHSLDMIRALWRRGDGLEHAHAVGADWRTMPLSDDSVDVVVGDGCYVVFPCHDDFTVVTREIHRVLRPGGRLAMRTFVRPEPRESVESVEAAFRAGAISSVHALKVRLWGALDGASGAPGILLADVWEAWRRFPMTDAIAEGRPGWSKGELEGIEGYRALTMRYFLPTASEFRSHLLERFEHVQCLWTGGESSDRCPTFVARKAD